MLNRHFSRSLSAFSVLITTDIFAIRMIKFPGFNDPSKKGLCVIDCSGLIVASIAGMGEDASLQHAAVGGSVRSEEHTSELQSRPHLVCRLLLEKKKTWKFPLDVTKMSAF